MKRIVTYLLVMLGMVTACSHENHDDVDVKTFAELIADTNVVVLDVRSVDEFNEGHIGGAINIDVKKDDFVEKSKATLPVSKLIAVYCRSGRRSVNAFDKLTAEGYKVVNLKGGIMAWISEERPIIKSKKPAAE